MNLALHWRILIGLILGLIGGLIVNVAWSDATWSSLGVNDAPAYLESLDDATGEGQANENAGLGAARLVRLSIGFIGDLFLRCLRFIAVPIVLFSLVAGVSSLNDVAKLGRIGGKTIGIYLCTTAVAITVGLFLANAIKPGSARFVPEETRERLAATQMDNAQSKISNVKKPSAWTTVLEIVPKNPFGALADTQMLQVVFFALAIGIGLTLIPEDQSAPVTAFFEAMTNVIIKLVHVIMWFAPFAVFALIAVVMADLGIEFLSALLAYSLVVIAGLLIMILVVYPGVLRIFTPVTYRRFFKAIAPAQILAFSSSSSSATLPVTMECARDRLGVSDDVTSFALPLGATVNMDGTALYQGVAAVFIAQLFGIPLGIGDQLTIVLTATLASIGTAAVPSAGLVMLVIVLQSVNMPDDVMTIGIAVIFSVDRILDMSRTVCNVTGDAMVATVVASSENELASEQEMAARLQHEKQVGLDENP